MMMTLRQTMNLGLCLLLWVTAVVVGCDGGESGQAEPAEAQPAATQPDVTFFGVTTADAERIVYIVAARGSMFPHFDFLKAELAGSIARLAATQQFSIIFYRDGEPEELKIDGRVGLLSGNKDNIAAAQAWAKGVVPGSEGKPSTDANKSLERAFEMLAGRPGVIFLVDDGFLHGEPDRLLDKLNVGRNVRVNTIGLVDRIPDSERLMKRIASDNGGQYVFVSNTDLGK